MSNQLQIVVADDDEENKLLLEIAFKEANITNPLIFVFNGLELLDHLRLSGREDAAPGIILLDLNMPKMGGLEVLRVMKQNEKWRKIPVIIFSTSDYADDIEQSYSLGASSYMVKPVSFDKLVVFLRSIKAYWFENIKLP